MHPTLPVEPNRESHDSTHWYRWRGYAVRWLLFGGTTGLFHPIVDDLDHYWLQRLYQFLFGLLFGAMCAVVFTLAENSLNWPRVNWKSWANMVASWFAVKLVVVSAMGLVG
jgi:hypothetical protein